MSKALIVFASCVDDTLPCNDTMEVDLGIPAVAVLVVVVVVIVGIVWALVRRRRTR